jgi:hypothetical protein
MDYPIREIDSYNSRYQEASEMKLPEKLHHYAKNDPSEWTSIGYIQDEPIYFTNNGELSRMSAKIELALPQPSNYRITINTTDANFDPLKIMLIRKSDGKCL